MRQIREAKEEIDRERAEVFEMQFPDNALQMYLSLMKNPEGLAQEVCTFRLLRQCQDASRRYRDDISEPAPKTSHG